MKRIIVFLFLVLVIICVAYGLSFYLFERKANESSKTNNEKLNTNVTTQQTLPEQYVDTKQNLQSNQVAHQQVEADVSVAKYQYYLVYDQNSLIVYLSDKKTVYDQISFNISRVSSVMKQKLEKGMEVKDESELYSVLESLCS